MALLRMLCVPSCVTQQNSICSSSSSSSSSCSPLSLSTPPFTSSLSHTTPLIKTRKPATFFAFQISCASVDTVSIENPEIEAKEEVKKEEVSGSKLCAQNVPWSSNADDIRKLFEKHGTVVNVELSMHNKTRNRGLAFVTMGSSEEASVALNSLQSYEFEGRTLNVNYANPQKKKSPDEPKKASIYNLFVTNLPYEARSKDLRKLFEDGNLTVYTANIVFNESTRQAAGYGFVSFNSKEDANTALSSFQGKELLGRPIRLARSKRFDRYEAKTNPSVDKPTELNPQQTESVDSN